MMGSMTGLVWHGGLVQVYLVLCTLPVAAWPPDERGMSQNATASTAVQLESQCGAACILLSLQPLTPSVLLLFCVALSSARLGNNNFTALLRYSLRINCDGGGCAGAEESGKTASSDESGTATQTCCAADASSNKLQWAVA